MLLLEDKIKITVQHSTSQWFVWIAWPGHLLELLYTKHMLDSAANKGPSTVNYHQSLAFDRPYLSCIDHIVTGGFSKKSFFNFIIIICTHMFSKTGIVRNFVIFTGKLLKTSSFFMEHLWWLLLSLW